VHALNGWNNFGLQQQCVQYVSSLSDETTPIEISVFAHREESKAPAAAAFAFHGTGLFLGMAESTTMTLSRELVIVTMNCFSCLIGTGVRRIQPLQHYDEDFCLPTKRFLITGQQTVGELVSPTSSSTE
jgi:hypothetical protein